MEKNIKDYLHLYLGCECQLFWRYDDDTLEYERNGILQQIRPETKDQHGLGFLCKTAHGNFIDYNYPYSDIKPILRPLSDMTEEEKNDFEWWSYEIMKEDLNQVQRNALKTNWYLKKHFDLFGLIESGLAIDKTTLKQITNEQ